MIAEAKLNSLKDKSGGNKVYASVEPASPFYKAEEYHQDYIAKTTRGRGSFY